MDDRFKRRPQPNRNTGPLNRKPAGRGAEPSNPQERPFVVRLDPQGKPGEFNFIIGDPQELAGRVPAAGLVADASGAIPPQLYKAVDEVLGFIYGLDQQAERSKKPRKL
jgi:hypothetical protein